MRNIDIRSWLRAGAATTLLAFLAACGSQSPAPTTPDSGYVLSVNLQAGDTEESLAQHYGGKVILWSEDKAILQLSSQAVAQMKARGVSMQSLYPNSALDVPMASASGTSASGWNAWAGGWNAWAGGWNAWAGGWNAWAGGSTVPSLPSDNNPIWNKMQLRQAHALSKNFGAGVKVAVIDTGVDVYHPMFSGRLAPSWQWKDFVDGDTFPQEVSAYSTPSAYGHGTGVAGIIAQVAPKATILPIRVLSPNGEGSLDNVIAGINHAINMGANVINLSLGSDMSVDPLVTALSVAASRGIYTVASVGNSGQLEQILFPALWARTQGAYPFVIGVGSYNTSSQLSQFSTYGSTMIAGAVGEQVASAFPGNQTARYTGTSFAAPLVSGAVALTLGETTDYSIRYNMMDRVEKTLFTNNVSGRSITSGRISSSATYGVNGMVDAANLLRSLPTFVEPASTQVNLASANPGFENTSGGWVYSGGAARNIYDRRSGWAGLSLGAGRATSTSIAVSPNTSYTVSAWFRNTYPSTWYNNTALLGLEERNAWGSYVDKTETTVNAFDTSYTSRSVTLTTGPNTTSLTIYLQRASGDLDIYVDDVRLVQNPQ